MKKTIGRKRKVNYEAVVEYAKANPTIFQSEIATYFGTSQSRVSQILRQAGVEGIYRGQAIKRKPGQSEEEFQWEQILHNAGLGMERGTRINSQRFYGYDPAKETSDDESATSNSSF